MYTDRFQCMMGLIKAIIPSSFSRFKSISVGDLDL